VVWALDLLINSKSTLGVSQSAVQITLVPECSS
jgi:hypothetical protein